MAETIKTRFGLTGNQLKILAMIAMTIDHVGMQIFPYSVWFRIIGRLAMPIYAYMIAEGCRYTHSRKNYLLRLAGMAALCQIVYFVAMGSLYMCILVTFSLSVSLIWLMDEVEQKKSTRAWTWLFLGAAGSFFLCVVLPDLLPRTDYGVDYGIMGVLLPVMIYGAGNRGLVIGLILLSLQEGGIQWFSLAAVPVLLLYNGQRGKANIGKLFYWYYPIHLVVIYFISLLV